MDLVDAQQARRILDRLVGYNISLYYGRLKRFICRTCSAVVALRLVIDRENEIRNFKPEEYWTIEGNLDIKV